MPQTISFQELSKNPLALLKNLQDDPVAVISDDNRVFYCVNEQDFLEFLAFKSQTPKTISPKKSILEFAGVLKTKTDVRLSLDELNDAIANAGASGKQGLD